MSLINVALFFTSIVNASMSVMIVMRNPKDPANKSYALFAIFVSLWAFGLAMFRISNLSNGLYWAIFYYICASLTVTYFLYFSILFLNRAKKKVSLVLHFLIHLPAVVVVFVLLKNINFFENYSLDVWGKNIKLGSSYIFYSLYIVCFSLAAFFILIKKYKKSGGSEKKQLKLVLVGTTIAFIFGIIFNLILPFFVYKYVWIGPFFSLFMVIMIAYAITKHHLMDVKTITAEIFSGTLMAIMFVNIFFYGTMIEFWFKVIIFIITSVVGYFLIKGVFKEVRAREEIELLATKLEFANLRLRQLDEAKSDFISIASHQLRTPLTAIKGYASMILEGSFGNITKKMREPVERILQSSQRLVIIIGDFLDVSHIERGTMDYNFEKTDLREMLSGLSEEFQASLAKMEGKDKNLKVLFKADPDADFSVKVDKNTIRQVFSNLIDNSIKYTEKGFVKIFLYRNEENGRVTVKIEDSGIGIAKDVLPNLFRKFVRAKGHASLHANGSGLGLYVAKEIIKAHHGRIWAESEGDGKGSRFLVEFS